jgi:putative hydrolase of the HAD superfamily
LFEFRKSFPILSMHAPHQPNFFAQLADFSHVGAWIFDLDNTLYRADSGLFAQIDARMTRYIVEHLRLPEAEANRLRRQYYREFGATLCGLIAVHEIDPERFLTYVHDIDLSVIAPDAALIAAMERLPGRRLVFTNGCGNHARRVLERIGLSHTIDRVFDIRAMAFIPKPRPEAYDRMVKSEAITPQHAAMFEDMAHNLKPAHALGMTTVWLNNGSRWSHQGPGFPEVERGHIHHEIDDLADFLHAVRL